MNDNDGYGHEDFDGEDDNFEEEEDLMNMEGEIEVMDEEDEEGGLAGDNFKNKRGYTKNKDRITSSFLTKYERARILGTRAL